MRYKGFSFFLSYKIVYFSKKIISFAQNQVLCDSK